MKRTDFRILVAEDDPAAQRLYEKLFRAEGYEMVMASSGVHVLDELEAGKFDLLITDLKLAGMSAIEAMPKVREMCPTMPVVVVSGYYGNMVEEFHQKGFNVAFFSKPVSLTTLKMTVRKILGIEAVAEAKKN